MPLEACRKSETYDTTISPFIDTTKEYLFTAKKRGSVVESVLKTVGSLIRDILYLPFNASNTYNKWDSNQCNYLLNLLTSEKEIPKTHSDYGNLRAIKDNFHIEMKEIPIQSPDKSKTINFNVCFITSKDTFSGPSLTYILTSFYGNSVAKSATSESEKWVPENINELASMLPMLLKALDQNHLKVKFLHLLSLGSVTLESLNNMDIDLVPESLIFNRAFTSTDKVAKTYSFAIRVLLSNIVRLSGWSANPEKTILAFFEKVSRETSLDGRECVFIKAVEDNYFGGNRGFEIEEKLKNVGMKVFSGEFYAPATVLRAQHSIPLSEFINTNLSAEKTGSSVENFLPMQEGESVLHALAKYIIQSSKKKISNVCLDIGGSQENISIMLKRIVPFLTECINVSVLNSI